MAENKPGSFIASFMYSALGKFMAGYIMVIVCLVYAVEWASQHETALTIIFTVFSLTVVGYIGWRIFSYFRRW